MPDRHGHMRDHRTPPSIRRPRVPSGARLVRQRGWLTTDHPDAIWYRLVEHSPDWSRIRLLVASQPDADARTLDVVVRPDGYVVPQPGAGLLGAEAIRIIGTVIRAGQRRTDS
jgi:hypothetical protein